MAVRVAINGFGRIGRNVLRAIVESGRTDIQVVSVNDLGPVETNAHLLRYDSVHGAFRRSDGQRRLHRCRRGAIRVTAEKDPSKLPHGELGVDVVMECTGFFTSKDKASAHLSAGAKRVLVSAPAENADLTSSTASITTSSTASTSLFRTLHARRTASPLLPRC
jgi:glyceraldehyde 3-phosphate dehydrogenase